MFSPFDKTRDKEKTSGRHNRDQKWLKLSFRGSKEVVRKGQSAESSKPKTGTTTWHGITRDLALFILIFRVNERLDGLDLQLSFIFTGTTRWRPRLIPPCLWWLCRPTAHAQVSGALVWQRDQTDICQWKFANPGGISTWQRSRMQAACLPRPRPSNKGKVRAGSCCACAVWSLTTWQTCRQLDSLPCSRSWARARFADIIEQAETVRKPSRNEHIHLISRRGTEVWRHWVSLSRPRQGREGHRQTGRSCLVIDNTENSLGTFAIRKCCDLQAWVT